MTFLEKWTRWTVSIADGIEAFMAAIESVLVSMFGRVATWVAPLANAIIVQAAAVETFDIAQIWGWCIALTLETLGIAAANLWLSNKEWNATKNKTDSRAATLLPFLAIVAYLIVTEGIIFAFEYRRYVLTHSPWGFIACLFPPLSAIAIYLTNERNVQYHRRVKKIQNTSKSKTDNDKRGNYGNYLSAMAARNGDGQMKPEEIMDEFKVSERTAYRWIDRYNGRDKS